MANNNFRWQYRDQNAVIKARTVDAQQLVQRDAIYNVTNYYMVTPSPYQTVNQMVPPVNHHTFSIDIGKTQAFIRQMGEEVAYGQAFDTLAKQSHEGLCLRWGFRAITLVMQELSGYMLCLVVCCMYSVHC